MLPIGDIEEGNFTKWDSEGIWKYAENPDLSTNFFIACGVLLSLFYILGTGSNGAVLLTFIRHSEVIISQPFRTKRKSRAA